MTTAPVAARDAQMLRTERERDETVRLVPCTVCGAGPTVRCHNGFNKLGVRMSMPASHTARYLAAVEVGLVPQMAGWPWTG